MLKYFNWNIFEEEGDNIIYLYFSIFLYSVQRSHKRLKHILYLIDCELKQIDLMNIAVIISIEIQA